jgi:hypothetical protein
MSRMALLSSLKSERVVLRRALLQKTTDTYAKICLGKTPVFFRLILVKITTAMGFP